MLPVTLLLGCDWIGRQADALGAYMPVIGQRCEHWQCMTASGQAESDAAKAQEQQQNPPPQPDPAPVYPPDATPSAVPENHLIAAPPI
ncbi:MAG: hypothetical protein KGI29_07735 [Pseudomonadota bacterium]|nr:hypothetical protein [Pseudomonadota bacterium]MDE3037266.1 hypothetical protein [Pseudomonadota bacterium]